MNVRTLDSYRIIWSSSYNDQLEKICDKHKCKYSKDGYGIFVYFSKDDIQLLRDAVKNNCLILGQPCELMNHVEFNGCGMVILDVEDVCECIQYIMSDVTIQLKYALNSFTINNI